MPLDDPHLSRPNYQGRSFKGRDLAGFDFKNADIRGTDFSQANLTGANFRGAKAGLRNHWRVTIAIASFLLSALFAYLSTFSGFWLAFHLTIVAERLPISLAFFVTSLVVFLIINAYKDLLTTIIALPIGIAVVMPISGIILPAGSGSPTAGSAGAGIAAISLAGAVGVAMATSCARITAGNWTIGFPLLGAVIGISSAILHGVADESSGNLGLFFAGSKQVWIAGQMATISGMALLGYSGYLSWRTAVQDQRCQLITDFMIAVTSMKGTCFRSANLKDADFSFALLKNTNFSKATINRTCWHNAIKLDWANVSDTMLTNSRVRALLTHGKGNDTTYVNMNLRGANLCGFDLSHLDLNGSDLSEAILQGACLEWANLTQIQAIATDFTNARMTGVCGLGSWNIDNSTQLENIDCRWVYLLDVPKFGTDDKERRPSSGDFSPGEFTALFREAIDTVDFIFRNGINWKIFNQSFQKIQIENQDLSLEIRSIENKGDGIVVVKISAPQDASKEHIHQQFIQLYGDAITLEAKRTQQLEDHEQEIQHMRSLIDHLMTQSTSEYVVLLNIGDGDFAVGFPVTLQVFKDGNALPVVQRTGQLPPNLKISQCHRSWQSAYRKSLKTIRLEVPSQITNVSHTEFFSDCLETANRLSDQLNYWLKSASFASILREMQIQLTRDHPTRIILQTNHYQLRQLPWQAWDFLNDYPKAEIAMSHLEYQSPQSVLKLVKPDKSQVKILAILGDSRGINLQEDQTALQSLDAAVTFLVEPQRQCLSDHLWHQQWDILFFAGHSRSDLDGSSAHLQINRAENLEISYLKSALKTAITHGLKLAIFNSCDGLGLANLFTDIHIPQLILMREPISDCAAQIFLINFLRRFSAGHSLYQSVREARERLQEVEEQYPCASWLPVIIQNPSESPLLWQDLCKV